MRIAIDGPSGSGKSSVAKELARRLNLSHLDTGAMYRLLGYKVYKDKLELDNIKDILKNLDIKIEGEQFYLDGEDVSNKIRENEISKYASNVSTIKEVREYMVDLQRKISEDKDVILDGRDIGTVVFPNAEIKIYLTASPEVRAKRRFLEDGTLDYEKILEDIKKRDFNDKNRKHSPLKKAEDAIEVDTDNMSFEEVINKIMEIVAEYEIKSCNKSR
ncbi:(d)CMP kinase [Pseudostreptobacillus hongkongensis]|uniref:(d)CMP kinase n=1 Tax=Pseudostreptobacillus hongkongensis TaxID=1162717 RepID=UPI0028D38C81|nr:(d)CMP kinase [Pseudostreptobacillus hongkongensis]